MLNPPHHVRGRVLDFAGEIGAARDARERRADQGVGPADAWNRVTRGAAVPSDGADAAIGVAPGQGHRVAPGVRLIAAADGERERRGEKAGAANHRGLELAAARAAAIEPSEARLPDSPSHAANS